VRESPAPRARPPSRLSSGRESVLGWQNRSFAYLARPVLPACKGRWSPAGLTRALRPSGTAPPAAFRPGPQPWEALWRAQSTRTSTLRRTRDRPAHQQPDQRLRPLRPQEVKLLRPGRQRHRIPRRAPPSAPTATAPRTPSLPGAFPIPLSTHRKEAFPRLARPLVVVGAGRAPAPPGPC
jgi:hypothetical protein